MKISAFLSRPLFTSEQTKKLEGLGELRIIEAQRLSAEEVISKAPDTEILIAGGSGIKHISRKMLTGLKHLKMIAALSVGYDWIDVEAAKDLGIVVSTIKGANAESVAEHTWGMILDLGKRITEFNRDVISKGEYKFGNYQGLEVYGKTIGIIGLGDIGKKVARIAHGFDMKVIGINASGKSIEGVELVTLDTLLKESDVIAICVPLNEQTNNMIDKEQIAKMKDNVIVVNCSREEAVNKEAIVVAVQSGKVFGYGIETEIMTPVLADDLYLSHPRILVTPHNAFNTIDAELHSSDTMIQNIDLFLQGKPRNVVS